MPRFPPAPVRLDSEQVDHATGSGARSIPAKPATPATPAQAALLPSQWGKRWKLGMRADQPPVTAPGISAIASPSVSARPSSRSEAARAAPRPASSRAMLSASAAFQYLP